MQTKWFPRLSGLALAALLTLLVGRVGADPITLEGTWDVTLRFPESTCTAPCGCPGNTPNLPIPALHQYQWHGALLEVSGGSPLCGPGVDSWATSTATSSWPTLSSSSSIPTAAPEA